MRRFFTPIFYVVVALCVFSVIHVQAQTAEKILIQGRIIDSKDKLPVIGATVTEQTEDKRTVNAIATNLDGAFAIKVDDVKHKLVISYIGYKTVALNIGTQRVFNISLEQSANDLTEVTVSARVQQGNGTGMNIDKRDQTTSTVTLNTKDIEELQATTIDQAIQGRLPGVDIVTNSGDPGAGMSIRIRGTATINGGTNPLIVLDGVPFETTIPTDFNFSTADNTQYADLLAIAPSDIKDISILKDAAATAIWGSRAANGVLVINTKRGVKGPPTISYTFKGTATEQPGFVPLLTGDQYSSFIPEMVMNATGLPLNTQTVKEFAYNPNNPYYYANYSNNTDWVKATSRTGAVYDNNLSISGGGDKARYFASVGYNDQKGTTIQTGLTRLNTRLNLDYIVSNKIHFTTYVSYAHSDTQNPYTTSLRNEAFTKMPNSSIYEYNEDGVLTPNYFSPASNIQGQYPGTYNPVALANTSSSHTLDDRIIPHFNVTYLISSSLTLTSDVNFDVNNSKNTQFLPQIATGRPFTDVTVNSSGVNDYDSYSVSTKTNFLYTPELGEKNSFQGLLSLSSTDNKTVTQNENTGNTASSFLQDPSSPGRINSSSSGISSGTSQTRSVSALMNGQYKFLDRYIVNVGLRLDGDSRFGPSNRYGLFPSVSARYRLSGEPFMQKFDSWLDDFSFRGSYGVSGNPPGGNYLFFNNYTNTTSNYLNQSGLYSKDIELDHLKWERLKGVDAGVNIILFKNRLNVDFGYYKNRTTDLITNISLASYNGYTNVQLNGGTLDNQGLELNLQSTPYKSKTLNIDFAINISNNINALRSVSPFYATQGGDITTNGHYLTVLQLNNPLGSFYGYKFKGVYKDFDATIARGPNGEKLISPDGTPVLMHFNYPKTSYTFQPGDSQYEDINHDGNINYQDVVYLGNGNPKFTGGFGPTFTYKGHITLQAFFNYRIGGQIVNQTEMNTTNEYTYDNQSTAVLRRWQNEGDVTDIPRALYNAGYNWLGSDRYVSSSTYLRWASITARYNFDKAIASRVKAKSLSVYITAQNLMTFTNYIGQDPEVSSKGVGANNYAIDNATTPPLKQFTLGLSASF